MQKRVPTELHSELSEYASLVSSLRTSQALDLVPQIALYGAASSRTSEYEDDDNGEEIDELDTTDDEGGRKTNARAPKTQLLSVEDQKWLRANHNKTRWPLRTDKVPRPEFDFEDEVQSIVERHRRQNIASNRRQSSEAASSSRSLDAAPEPDLSPNSTSHQAQDRPNDVERPSTQSQEDEGDSSDLELNDEIALPILTSLAAEHLRTLLDACALHVPRVSSGSHHRLAPMGWKSVLSAAASSGAVSPEVLERVEARLAAMYPPKVGNEGAAHPQSVAAERAKVLQASQDRVSSLLTGSVKDGDGDLFHVVGLPQSQPRKKRKKKTKGKKTEALKRAKDVEENEATADEHGEIES